MIQIRESTSRVCVCESRAHDHPIFNQSSGGSFSSYAISVAFARLNLLLHAAKVEQGCLKWGLRTIIPPSLQEQILSELHKADPGVARMKAAARSHVWWPEIDSAIEERARGCKQCFKTRKAPQVAPLSPWSWPTAPWQRIHIDFATHQSNHYLIVVDAHSKWPEVIGPMKTTTAEATVNAMRNIFPRYALPKQIVIDNGPPFQSAEYEEFLRQNGIQRILVSPYHPSSNGLAERFVQAFKHSLEASASDPACALQQRIQNFLLSYRSNQHATTGSSPNCSCKENCVHVSL